MDRRQITDMGDGASKTPMIKVQLLIKVIIKGHPIFY
jgi:hypothetical protein